MNRLLVSLTVVLLSAQASAHHGAITNPALYVTENFIELEGEIIDVLWRNPHARARIRVVDADGVEKVWELELGPNPRGFERRGIVADDLLGPARAAGYQSIRNPYSLGVQHLLLPDGRENIQGRDRDPMWADSRVSNIEPEFDPAKVAEARRTANGIFRVWGFRIGDRPRATAYEAILTEPARELAAQFDPARDHPDLECRSGLPMSMLDRQPMQIIDEGDRITIHVGEYDIRRIIYLDSALPDAEREASPLGYSVGHWEGEQLVVSTTHIDWPYLDPYGTPQSNQVEYVERFNVSEDDTNLEYSITATDPVMFNSPVTIELLRSWTPGIEVPPYNCLAEWDGSGGVDG
jgi:hypothetical protein